MISRMSLLAFILGVPVVAFLVALGIQGHMNSELRDVARAQYPDAAPAEISGLTMDVFRDAPDPEAREVYRTYLTLGLMKGAAVVAGVIGLALLLCIWIAGRRAVNNRDLLVSLFRPGLYLAAAIVVGLMVVYGALAMGSIYYGESAIVGRIHVGIILAIGVGALVGVVTVSRSIFAAVKKARTLVIGTALPRTVAPELWSRVESVAERIGALPPQNLVVGLDPNFFVTEADVACLDGLLTGRTMYCSLPLSRILTVDELVAVVGHELGHFKGDDTQFSQRFYPIYRGTITSITSLQESAAGWRSIAILPALGVLSYFLECFSLAESRISRERELVADKAGANITSPTTAAAALVKIHAFAPLWNGLQDAAVAALRSGKALANVSEAFALAASTAKGSTVLDDIASRHLTHPTDSHPPLGARLESLGITLPEVSDLALSVSPPDAAIKLVPGHEEREKEISMAFQGILARGMGIKPAEDAEPSADGQDA